MQLQHSLSCSKLARLSIPQRSPQSLLIGIAARSGSSRQLAVQVRAAKGFGKSKQPVRKATDDDDDKSRKQSGRRKRLYPESQGPIPGQAQQQQTQQQQGLNGQPQGQFELGFPGSPGHAAEDDDDFLTRLQALKEKGKERAAAAAASTAEANDAAASAPAIFDAAPTPASADTDIYANPPPLAQTLLAAASGGDAAAASGISDPKLRDANIGPSQLGLAAGALVFIAVFVVVAAGDYAPASRRYAGVRPAQQPPDPIEEKILKGRIALYQDQLQANPSNDDATLALANSYARLLQYDRAAELLEGLTRRTPDDAEAWRLLGESSLLSQQPRKAVPAFERAVELRRQQQTAAAAASPAVVVVSQPDLQLLTGLVDAYIANGEHARAIETLKGIREQLRSSQQQQLLQGQQQQQAATAAAEGAGAAASASSAAEEGVPAGAAIDASSLATALPVLQAPPLTGDATDAAATSTSTSTTAAAESSAANADAAPSSGQSDAQPSSSSSSSQQPSTTSPEAQQQQQGQPDQQQQPAAAPAPAAPAVRPLDPVGVELLRGKVYSSWRGHEQDALAAYDELLAAYPEDYRGYLAKGLFLKERGRKADAERMFLQARFFAPASKQQLVRALAEASPTLELPDNN
ncbi:hypothetical protein Agub_g11584 [Astrephomene gubernaculifera]|uniref:Uncharacterized protein n=1 Tax=Astrephomene gubernaculifera TaxID=47775 RepID=A0AAD3DWS5_9CHLO|nr:hypothetical protein Agub_g11584 [Astrephomene gubernaculifera]